MTDVSEIDARILMSQTSMFSKRVLGRRRGNTQPFQCIMTLYIESSRQGTLLFALT